MSTFLRQIDFFSTKESTLFSLGVLPSLIAVLSSLFFDQWILALLPFAVLALVIMSRFPKKFFYAFFALLPFSIEVYFSNGLGTDLPTEPIILFFFCWGLILLAKGKKTTQSKNSRVLLALLSAHLFWILLSSLFAEFPLVSFKFLLAKLWYVLPFFFLSQVFLKTKKDYTTWLNVFFIGLMISVAYVIVRHAGMGFAFDKIGAAGSPFFRNHVNYAALLTISLPFAWFMSRRSANKKTYLMLVLVLLVAIFLSYTRAAIFTSIILVIAAGLVKYRLLFVSSLVALMIAIGGIGFMIHENSYLHYAPNYESTVAHTKFDNLVEATYKMEDISTMERLHRWIAGVKMVQERPWTGFGPNNFFFTYKPYTNNSFQTYVSDNPDKSGVHNYYLMVALEQGLPGVMIFIGFLLALIYKAERAIYRMASGFERDLLLASVLAIVGIVALNLINDLFEAVKIGVFFFVAAGIIYKFDWEARVSSS